MRADNGEVIVDLGAFTACPDRYRGALTAAAAATRQPSVTATSGSNRPFHH